MQTDILRYQPEKQDHKTRVRRLKSPGDSVSHLGEQSRQFPRGRKASQQVSVHTDRGNPSPPEGWHTGMEGRGLGEPKNRKPRKRETL